MDKAESSDRGNLLAEIKKNGGGLKKAGELKIEEAKPKNVNQRDEMLKEIK